MGGAPLTALNLVAYSLEELGDGPLRSILRGGADVAAAAGVAIVGGHSIDDREPKYGLAVTGAVDPRRLLRNSTARVGDALYLTKPVGGGVASTAAKRGVASEALVRAAVDVMTTLKREASAAALAAGARAATAADPLWPLRGPPETCLAGGGGAGGGRRRGDRRAGLRPAGAPAGADAGERRGGGLRRGGRAGNPGCPRAPRLGSPADRRRQPPQPRVGGAVGRVGGGRARG